MKKYDLNGFNIIEFEELDSTNTRAMELPERELADKTVVMTFRQMQGRGQTGNKWESEPYKNLSVTFVLMPQRYDAARQFAFSMVIALGCRDFIARYTGNCSIKWPNDVYVGDRKIAGILIEHHISGRYIHRSLCGIGVNINQRKFVSDAPNPVSLFQLTGKEMDLKQTLAEFLDCMAHRYGQIYDYEKLEEDYLRYLYRKEGEYRWEDGEGAFRASVAGIDEYGRLVLKDESGCIRKYGFKEVVFK